MHSQLKDLVFKITADDVGLVRPLFMRCTELSWCPEVHSHVNTELRISTAMPHAHLPPR